MLRLLLLLATAMPLPALAADGESPEIVVTARRLEERSRDVPLAMDVVSDKSISAGGINSLQTLAANVPGLSFESGFGGASASPALRGQNQPNIQTLDSVGVFVDGVYQANRNAVDVEPLDLARIEVVQGPQSALFGHSSFAGLIHFVPARPTEELYVSGAADLGSDNLYGIRGTVSGSVTAQFKVRLAALLKTADGTYENAARPGQHLGNTERFALAASLATREGTGPLSARLAGRYGDTRSTHPPSFTLDQRHYNCGGRDAASGVWSYFCGKAPIPAQVSLSPGVPDSRTRGGQIALHLTLDAGGVELQSDTSYYHVDTASYRDFDGSAAGELFGVCAISVNCSGVGSLTNPVVRLQRVNMVQLSSRFGREIAQELRIRSTGQHRFAWHLGATVFRNRAHAVIAYGAARGQLAATERFSSLVLSNPQRVGAPAVINFALVGDPEASQIVQIDEEQTRRTIAFFATADYRLGDALRLRGEVRSTWERLVLDSRTANFLPGFGTGAGPQHFHDITPRFSLDWRPANGWLTFASYARGSRSGGINAFPNLLPEEQTFAPETNWTAEAGVKYYGSGIVRSARLTAYDIDWRNTQLVGLSISPGVGVQILRNAKGVRTRGIEFAAELAPTRWLAVDFAWSYANPRYKHGSEDPGASAICGLSLGVTTSSFCTIRPSLVNPGQLVPDISGNVPARAVRKSWAAGITISPPLFAVSGLQLHLDISHQGNVFDRQIDGLYFGARTLLGARLSVPLGRLRLELWGTNLGNDRYVRFATSRPPQFYLGQPRPTDLIPGERRRIGLTLRFANPSH